MSCLTKKTAEKFLADPKSVDLSKYTKVSWEVSCYYLREILPIWRKIVKDDLRRATFQAPVEWINGRIVLGKPPSKPLSGKGCKRINARKASWWLPRNVCDWFWKKLEDGHKGKSISISPEAADLLNKMAIFWFWLAELGANLDKKEQLEPVTQPASNKKLSQIKKIINSKNGDNFALAVELVRALELDNEATWLSMLTEAKIKKISAFSNKNTHLLLEVGAKGATIRMLVLHNLALGGANLTSLSEAEPSILSFRNWLDLSGLTSLSDAGAHALSQQRGTLNLSGLATLSDAAAQALGKHEGTLYLHGLTSLSDSAAESLAQHKGLLGLNGLLELSDFAASQFSNHRGQLELYGLRILSKNSAQELAKHKKKILLGSASIQEALTLACKSC